VVVVEVILEQVLMVDQEVVEVPMVQSLLEEQEIE
jgi:hypothetical protein